MIKKILVLVLSLLFLFSGGLCSLFLFDDHSFWSAIACVMLAVCVWALVDVIYWMAKNQSTLSNIIPEKSISPTLIFVLTAGAIVIAVYVACWSGALNLRMMH